MTGLERDDVTIRPATTADAEAIAGIYNHYVTGSVVTFEENTVPPPEIARRIADVQAASAPDCSAISFGSSGSAGSTP